MPPKASKRKAKAVSSEDDAWTDANSQPGKRARVSASNVDEDDKDPVPKANNQFQSWADWQPKLNEKERNDKRDYSENFKRSTDKNREDIQSQLNKANEDLINADHHHAELLKKAWADFQPASKAGSITDSTRSVQKHPLFATGQSLLRDCHNLIAAHDQATGKTLAQFSEQVGAMRTQWQIDISQMKQAVLHGEQYGQKLVGCQVDLWGDHEHRDQLLTPPREGLKSAGEVALDIHQNSMDRLLNGSRTWGEQAVAYVEGLVGVIAVSEEQHDGI